MKFCKKLSEILFKILWNSFKNWVKFSVKLLEILFTNAWNYKKCADSSGKLHEIFSKIKRNSFKIWIKLMDPLTKVRSTSVAQSANKCETGCRRKFYWIKNNMTNCDINKYGSSTWTREKTERVGSELEWCRTDVGSKSDDTKFDLTETATRAMATCKFTSDILHNWCNRHNN